MQIIARNPHQFLDPLSTSSCNEVAERHLRMKKMYRVNLCIYIFWPHTWFAFPVPYVVFLILFYGIHQIDSSREIKCILEQALFLFGFSTDILRKLLLVHKNFCPNRKSCFEIFGKYLLLYSKVRADCQENIKEQGPTALICSLYPYSFLT